MNFIKTLTEKKIVIATMHQKEKIIGPLIEKHLGATTVIPQNFNTDKFGTFTGEIKRLGNQLEAARKKAHEAMKLTRTDCAIASEGSFGPHPSIPLIQSNFELIIFIDKTNKLEIFGHYRTFETNADGIYVKSLDEAISFAKKHNFPESGIILKYWKKSKHTILKDISTFDQLSYHVKKMLSRPFINKIFIETDLRAHRNPLRMKAIEKATINLIKNIKSICPQCDTPGFVATDFEKGLLCFLCKNSTDLPINEIYLCKKCKFSTKKPTDQFQKFADPKHCDYCNP